MPPPWQLIPVVVTVHAGERAEAVEFESAR
jgi:hypothetical protein